MALRCKHGLALVASGAVGMGLLGCSDAMRLADLPNITRLPTRLLSKEEQAKTMNRMIETGQNHQAEAIKEIEGTRVETGGIEAAGTDAAKGPAPAK